MSVVVFGLVVWYRVANPSVPSVAPIAVVQPAQPEATSSHLLAAATAIPAQPSPIQVARAYMQAAATHDDARIVSLTCPGSQSVIHDSFPQIDTIRLDPSLPSYDLISISSDGSTAIVHVKEQ